MIRPSTAIASKPAVRETALLTPEAMPAWLSFTEFITVVVNGATLIAMPRPSTTTAGKKVVQYLPPTPGLTKRANPIPAMIGPMTKGRREPYRLTNPPDQRESKNMIKMNGSDAAPAAVGE